MSDYYSAVRLQLELDELMAQIVKLQARIKDVDLRGKFIRLLLGLK